jgi:ankyrin repeat protein
MLNGFNSISDLQVYWQICEKAYLQSAHRQDYQHLVEPLAKLYSYIIEYQARVICHLSEAQLSRAWQDVTGSHHWAETKEEIDRLDEICRRYIPIGEQEEVRKNRDAQLQEMQKSRIIQEDILNVIKESRQDEKEAKLLGDLARAAGDYQRYKNMNRKRVPGTCEWFLADERFCKWRDSKLPGVLWVSAGPGRGKSVLSRSLIDEGHLNAMSTITITRSAILASGSTTTICYFFFKDGSDGGMDGAHALCAILHQLFTCPSTSGLIKYALPSHKENGATLTEKFSELWRILTQCVTSSDAGELICVLDALDECKEESRHEIISALEQFYSPSEGWSTSSKLKFLVTSRPYENLESSFQKLRSTAAYVRFDGDDKSEQIRREIDLVIDARVQDIAGSFSPEDQHKISKRLKSMENRTYLWLHLTFDIIEKDRTNYGKRSDVEKLLSKLPSRVSDAYEKILSRSTNYERTKLLLQIMLAAARPLSLDEANVALTLAVQTEGLASHEALEEELWPRGNFQSIVQNLCGLFISVYEGKLSFIHQTAREFLINRERQGTWEGSLTMAESHTTMSQLCLHYLLLPDIGDPNEYDFPKDKFAFLSYAAAHWPLHYGSQDSAAAEQCREDARMLCNMTGYYASLWVRDYFHQRGLWHYGWTDLALASYLGLKEVVQLILSEEETDVNAYDGTYQDYSSNYGTALQAASAEGHGEIVHILLDAGADVEAKGGKYDTALQAASAGGHREIVYMLLDAGANVNAKGGKYDTALQAASAQGHRDIVDILLDAGANVNACDGTYWDFSNNYGTALQAACAGGHMEIVHILLDAGADVNLEGDGPYGSGQYGNALFAALARGHKEIVEVLVNNGADVNARCGRSGQALYVAALSGYEEIVQILLDAGADVNAHNEVDADVQSGQYCVYQRGEYDNALQAASVGGHEEIVKLLLEKGANVNVQGGRYNNALEAASDRGHEGIVKLLIDKGAEGYYIPDLSDPEDGMWGE